MRHLWAVWATLLFAPVASAAIPVPEAVTTPEAATAERADGTWISSTAISDEHGRTWVAGQFRPAQPVVGQPSQIIALTRLDAHGRPVLTRRFDGSSVLEGLSLSATSDGGVTLSGRFTDQVAFDKPVQAQVAVDVFVTRFDAAGTPEWTQRVGVPVDVEPVDEDGALRVVLVGGGWGEVHVDGRAVARAPLAARALDPGSHDVRVVNPYLGVDHVERVTVGPGETVTVRVPLP